MTRLAFSSVLVGEVGFFHGGVLEEEGHRVNEFFHTVVSNVPPTLHDVKNIISLDENRYTPIAFCKHEVLRFFNRYKRIILIDYNFPIN